MGKVYDTAYWRSLPRTECALQSLLGGECSGLIGLHHLDPISEGGDPEGDLMPCCQRHHTMLHAVRRRREAKPRRCHHRHVYPGSREACERRMNRAA